MAFLPEIDTLPTDLSTSATILIVQDGQEYRVSPLELADLFKENYGFAVSNTETATEPKRLTLNPGITTYTPTVNYITGYSSYYIRLTANLVVTLPVVPSDKYDADVAITLDVRQDGTGNRNITFNNVTDWYNIDPYDAANPAALQVNKAANAFGAFSFRNVAGSWFGAYSRPV